MPQHNPVHLDELAAERLLSRPYCVLSEMIVQKLKELGAQNISRHEVPSVDDLPGLVQSHFGVGVWPLSRKLAGELMVNRLEGIDMSRWIHIHTVFGRRLSAGAATLVGLLRSKDWSSASPSASENMESVH